MTDQIAITTSANATHKNTSCKFDSSTKFNVNGDDEPLIRYNINTVGTGTAKINDTVYKVDVNLCVDVVCDNDEVYNEQNTPFNQDYNRLFVFVSPQEDKTYYILVILTSNITCTDESMLSVKNNVRLTTCSSIDKLNEYKEKYPDPVNIDYKSSNDVYLTSVTISNECTCVPN